MSVANRGRKEGAIPNDGAVKNPLTTIHDPQLIS